MTKFNQLSINKILTCLFLFLFSTAFAQENDEMKSYSFTEFFQMLEDEKDTVFTLKNALIILNYDTDSAFQTSDDLFVSNKLNKEAIQYVIDKHVSLDNVQFGVNGYEYKKGIVPILKDIHFKKSLSLHNVYEIVLFNSIIEGSFRYSSDGNVTKKRNVPERSTIMRTLLFSGNIFNGKNTMFLSTDESSFDGQIFLELCFNTINLSKDGFFLFNMNHSVFSGCDLVKNTINGNGRAHLIFDEPANLSIVSNNFNLPLTRMWITINDETLSRLKCISNKFKHLIILNYTGPTASADIEWEQFENRLISRSGLDYYFEEAVIGLSMSDAQNLDNTIYQKLPRYLSEYRLQHVGAYKAEMELRGTFYNYYKSKFDKESANAVYIELKNLETERLAYLYRVEPTLNGYFKWKMNQFLKVFSDYGTNPTKSIIFSIYVILLFGLVYLFFPNSWDSHGKNRIIHRYGFFMKYMMKDVGIHEAYLEGKQQEFDEYKSFSRIITESKNKVPRFFTATSSILLKWANSGSVISAFLLKRIDVMKGKWSELPKGKRIWKSSLLILIFTIAVIYDVFIKMVNALMLSINTFTTLGFGEIPIKGLPRYLAIIEGFIGWFLLTIFSVSLISQLME